MRHRFSALLALLLTAAAVLTGSGPLRAAPNTWIMSSVSGPSDVITVGKLVGAMNAGDPTNARAVNGVTFATDPGGAGPHALGTATVSFGNLASTFNAFWPAAAPGGSAPYDAALDYGRYGAAGSGSVTLGGLVAGKRYLVQLWITDTRAGYNTRSRTVDGVTTISGGPNIATGAFTADATTEVIALGDPNSFGPQINLLQIREIAAVDWTMSNVSSVTNVSTAGTLVGAMNVGDTVNAGTVNGVNFAPDGAGAGPHTMGSLSVTFGNLPFLYNAFWQTPAPGGNGTYEAVLDDGRYGDPGSGTMTLGGLVNGRTYLVQLWITDTRTGANARTRRVDEVNTISGGPGNIATGTFVANGTSQIILLGDPNFYGPQLNLLQVREIARPPLMVMNTNDSGVGSLRQAIVDANSAAGADTIEFDPALAGQTITLTGGTAAQFTDTALTTVDASALAAPVTISGGNAMRMLFITADASAKLRGLILSGGSIPAGNGGAVLVQGALTIEDCQLRQNVAAGSGGAIAASITSTLTVTRCTFEENSSSAVGQFGGAISTAGPAVIAQSTFTGNLVPVGSNSSGGAVYSLNADLTISQCTFSGNSAGIGGAVGCPGTGALSISQSTFTGNSAVTGGAIQCGATGTATLTHVTISGNHATSTGFSGGGLRTNRPLSLAWSIVAGNTSAGTADDIENQGTLTMVGSNLVQTVVNSGAGPGSISGPAPIAAVPQLAPLYNYGGPTQTTPPLSTSPALNAATGSTITTDQRGRAVSGVPDLGACEHSITMADLPDQTIIEDANGAGRTFPCTIDAASMTTPAPTFSAVSSNPALVTSFSFPGTNPNRSVRVFLAPDAHGTATITVTATWGAASVSRSFLLTVTPVNDAPVFTAGAAPDVPMNYGLYTLTGWATGIDDGDPEEAQTLTFLVTSDNPELFSEQPAISFAGTLTFTPAPWQTGSAKVTVQLRDKGSDVSPNVNLSAAQTFTITVTGPAALSVTNVNDSGAGSLRNQIAAALSAGGSRRITFASGLSGQTITLASQIVLDDPASSDVLSIDTSGLPGGLTIDGGAGVNRIFSLPTGDRAALRGLTLTGGVGNPAGPRGADVGGAIYTAPGSTLTLTQCTLAGNSADEGGAIYNDEGALTLSQCTLSGNTAVSGGAVHSSGPLSLVHCTLSGNSATNGGGIYPGDMVWLTNSIIAGNTATNGPDIRLSGGTILRSGNNLIGSNAGVTTQFPTGVPNANGDYVGVPAVLAILGNYGGPTMTRPPVITSFAIDAAASSTITRDQRGIAVSGTPDIGAAENIVPAISDFADLTVNEDSSAAARTVAFTVGDAPGYTGTPTLSAVSSNNGLVTSLTLGGSGTSRTVLLNVPPDASGSASITVSYGNGVTTRKKGFTFTVLPVNDAPTLTAIPNPAAISEDAALQTINLSGIGTGATNETQSLSITATSNNTSLIPNPAVTYTSPDATGALTFTPVANAHGSAVITVTVSDGQPANSTVSRAFTVTVNPVNDAPSFTKGADQSVVMNSAQTVVTGWATGMSIGPANEIGQTFTGFIVTNDNNTLFSAQPAIAPDGTLSFTPAAWKTGVATVTVRLQDSGNSAAPSVNISAPQTFTITVTSGTPFNAWKLAQFGPDVANPAIAGDAADADKDGLDTMHEYAAGSNPLAYTPTPLTATPAPGGGMVFEFPWNPQATDLRYHLQHSSDIGVWSDLYDNNRATAQITRAPGVTSTENATTGIITVTIPASSGERGFWKLQIGQP